MCVTCTPGTGKSVLGVYCFLRAVLEAESLTPTQLSAQEFMVEEVTEQEMQTGQIVLPSLVRYYYSCGDNYLTVDADIGNVNAVTYGSGKFSLLHFCSKSNEQN